MVLVFEYHDKTNRHIGSTAINDMMGKPIIDLCVITNGLLPNIPDDIH